MTSASIVLAFFVKSRTSLAGSAGCKPVAIPIPAHSVIKTLSKTDFGTPETARRLGLGLGAPIGMKNLARLFWSEHGRAPQEFGGSQTDGGGSPDNRARQWDDESLRVHGCFGSPHDLVPGVTLGALVCQLEQRMARALLAQNCYGCRGIDSVNDCDPAVGVPWPEENVILQRPKDRQRLAVPR